MCFPKERKNFLCIEKTGYCMELDLTYYTRDDDMEKKVVWSSVAPLLKA